MNDLESKIEQFLISCGIGNVFSMISIVSVASDGSVQELMRSEQISYTDRKDAISCLANKCASLVFDNAKANPNVNRHSLHVVCWRGTDVTGYYLGIDDFNTTSSNLKADKCQWCNGGGWIEGFAFNRYKCEECNFWT